MTVLPVYYEYPRERVFRGPCEILQGLKHYNVKLVVNGGDTFVSRCLEEDTARSLLDGVNQETVFTSIDFEDHSYGAQKEEETAYFKAENGFLWYNAEGLELR